MSTETLAPDAEEARRLEEALTLVEGAKERIGGKGLTAGILDAAGIGDWGDAPYHCRSIAFACRLCRSDASLRAFRELILPLEARAGKVLHHRPHHGQPSYLLALQHLAELHPLWRQSPERWKPPTGPAPRQFDHLLRFLLAQDEAERFHDAINGGGPSEWARLWFGPLTRDLHGASGAPRAVVMTKRMAYHFLDAPEPFDGIRALRWSQILGFGGGTWMAKAFDLTRLSWQLWEPEEEEWWASFLQWFARQRIGKNNVSPLLDYVYSQRYGVPKLGLPPHPDFTLKGRALRPLMEKMKEWHEDVSRLKSMTDIEFPKSDIGKGRYEIMLGGDVTTWTVEQILTSSKLYEEGRMMRHCVATYYQQVEKGGFTIWSMQIKRGDLMKRAVTIQVKDRRIIQCRGRCNRQPKGEEKGILRSWASENHLKIEKM